MPESTSVGANVAAGSLSEVNDVFRDPDPETGKMGRWRLGVSNGEIGRVVDVPSPRSMVVQFDDDQLDESDELYSVLRDSVARRQAEGEVEGAAPAVRLARLGGTHVTPLTQDNILPAEKVSEYASAAANVSPVIEAPRRSFLRDVDATWGELEAWLAPR